MPKPLVNASHEEAVLDDSMSEINDEDDQLFTHRMNQNDELAIQVLSLNEQR